MTRMETIRTTETAPYADDFGLSRRVEKNMFLNFNEAVGLVHSSATAAIAAICDAVRDAVCCAVSSVCAWHYRSILLNSLLSYFVSYSNCVACHDARIQEVKIVEATEAVLMALRDLSKTGLPVCTSTKRLMSIAIGLSYLVMILARSLVAERARLTLGCR